MVVHTNMKFITKKYLIRLLKKTGIVITCLAIIFFLLNWIFPLRDRIEYSIIITDAKGEVINAYLTSDQKWRMKTELNEISPLLRKAIIAKEDKYFYSHPGVNAIAVVKAFFKNIFRLKTTSGASTITMQVARALEHRKRNIGNKIIETFRAFQLEMKYSKNEILQMYLNLVPYGSNIEGVKSASILYINKNPDHLSLAEITALSIIPNRPSSLVMGKNNILIVQERNKWLKKFAAEKIFTQKEIEDALAEPLTAARGTVPHYLPHLSYKLKKQGGDIIRTNIIMNTQMKTEKLVGDYVRTLRLKNIKNTAVVVIDNRTHKVVTYVGSSDFKDTTDGGQVNGAAAVREPGSTLKPLLYGLCIDEGYVTPAYTQADTNFVKTKLISAAANYMITDILSRVNRPDFPLNWQATEHMPRIAWKTGTSYGRRDAWSIGYDKNYTVGVWV